MGWGMEFANKISIVTIAWTPVDDELFLGDTIAYPIKTHVNGFGGFLFDVNVGKANSDSIVDLDRGGRLGMTHFSEGNAEG